MFIVSPMLKAAGLTASGSHQRRSPKDSYSDFEFRHPLLDIRNSVLLDTSCVCPAPLTCASCLYLCPSYLFGGDSLLLEISIGFKFDTLYPLADVFRRECPARVDFNLDVIGHYGASFGQPSAMKSYLSGS